MDEIDALLKEIKSDDPEKRKMAAEALKNYEDKQAVEALIEAMEDEDKSVRYFARKSLIELKKKMGDNVPEVSMLHTVILRSKVQLLKSTDYKKRLSAMKILTELNAKEVLPDLIELLETEQNEYIIASLLILIGKLGGKENIEIIARYLKSYNRRIRANAVEALSYIEDDSIFKIVAPYLLDKDHRVKANAARIMFRYSKEKTLELLKEMLNEDDKWKKYSAIYVLRNTTSIQGRELLIPLLKDKNFTIRLKAAEAIFEIEENLKGDFSYLILSQKDEKKFRIPEEIIRETVKLLDEDDGNIRIKAARILYYIARSQDRDLIIKVKELIEREKDENCLATYVKLFVKVAKEEAIPIILPLLSHENDRVKANTIEAFTMLRNPCLIANAIPMLNSSSHRVVAAAARYLAGFAPWRVEEFCEGLLRSKKDLKIKSAIYVMGEIGDEETKEKLISMLNEYKDYAEPISRAISRINKRLMRFAGYEKDFNIPIDEEKRAILLEKEIELLKSSDIEVRSRAVHLVKLLLNEKNYHIVRQALTSNNKFVRATLVKIIAKKRYKGALQDIINCLKDTDDRVRANAVEAIGMFNDVRLVEYLTPLLQDKNNRVRINAALALFRISETHELQKLKEVIDSFERTIKATALKAIDTEGVIDIPEREPEKNKVNLEIFTKPSVVEQDKKSKKLELSLIVSIAAILIALTSGIYFYFSLTKVDKTSEKLISTLNALPDKFSGKNLQNNINDILKSLNTNLTHTKKKITSVSLFLKQIQQKIDNLAQRNKLLEAKIKEIKQESKNVPKKEDIPLDTFKEMIDQAKKLIADKKYQQARQILDELKLRGIKHHEINYNLGLIYMDSKNYEKALKEFRKAMLLKKGYYVPLYMMGLIYEKLRKYDKAIEFYEKYYKHNPEDVFNILKLADILKLKKKYKQAVRYYEFALRKPECPRQIVYKKLAEIYLKENNLALAEKNLRLLLEKAGDSKELKAFALTGLGIIYYKKGLYLEAMAILKKALKLENLLIAHLYMGRIYIKQKRFGSARAEAELVLKKHGKNYEAYLILADVEAALENFENAEKFYKKVLKLNPTHAIAKVGLGKVLMEQKKFKEAYEAYKDAIFNLPVDSYEYKQAEAQIYKLETIFETQSNKGVKKQKVLRVNR